MHPLAVWLKDFKTNYTDLRNALVTYRTQEVTAHQVDVGQSVIAGLNQSLCSAWRQRERGKSATIGTKFSFTLRFT